METPRFNSLAKTVKVEVSLSDLSTADRIALTRELLRETGLERELIDRFGLDSASLCVEFAFKEYERIQRALAK